MKSLKWEGIGTKNLFPHTSRPKVLLRHWNEGLGGGVGVTLKLRPYGAIQICLLLLLLLLLRLRHCDLAAAICKRCDSVRVKSFYQYKAGLLYGTLLARSVYCSIPDDFRFTAVISSCIFFFNISPQISVRTSELAARKYFTSSWGYGVTLISGDSIRLLVPNFRGDGKLPPIFAKNVTAPSFGALS